MNDPQRTTTAADRRAVHKQAMPFAQMPTMTARIPIDWLSRRRELAPTTRYWMSPAALASSPVRWRCRPPRHRHRHHPGHDRRGPEEAAVDGADEYGCGRVGDVLPLPFPESSFSAVITRYSFHHFLEPEAVLAEMVRVCQPGGRVAVVDVFMSTPEQAEAYNRMEKLRDPSHTLALLLAELTECSTTPG